MKIRFTLAAMALFAFPAGYATAETLNETDTAFVQARMLILFATKTCGAKEKDGGLEKFAERTGVDYEKTYNAIASAFNASIGLEYDSASLIPAVTVATNRAGSGLLESLRADRVGACSRILVNTKRLGLTE